MTSPVTDSRVPPLGSLGPSPRRPLGGIPPGPDRGDTKSTTLKSVHCVYPIQKLCLIAKERQHV